MKFLEELVDELSLYENVGRVGHLFTPAHLRVAGHSDFPVHNANASDLDLGALYSSPQFEFKFVPHAGKGFTPLRAIKSALGEALERVSPILRPPRPILLASYSELEGPALGPGICRCLPPNKKSPLSPLLKNPRGLGEAGRRRETPSAWPSGGVWVQAGQGRGSYRLFLFGGFSPRRRLIGLVPRGAGVCGEGRGELGVAQRHPPV